MEFSEEEIKEKLKQLGYVNIPNHKLKEFIKGDTYNLSFLFILFQAFLGVMYSLKFIINFRVVNMH